MTARPTIDFLGGVKDEIEPGLLPRFERELRCAFPEAVAITVCKCLHGYSENQSERIVLGVEAREPNTYRTHVVKLGSEAAVGWDYDGWKSCVVGNSFASRIFLPLSRARLPDSRIAVIYQDAYTLFDREDDSNNPQLLDRVFEQAVCEGVIDPVSVQRVIRQIYADLYRGFYHRGKVGSNEVKEFYDERLHNAVEPWRHERWRLDLRRDLIWMFCGRDALDAPEEAIYLDAFDYVTWALADEYIPPTLVGCSHGDLHGRNILVGVQRGEAEYPSVFDFGRMAPTNVLVWDFVKLETETKVRLLQRLFEEADARDLLLARHRRRLDLRYRERSANKEPAESPVTLARPAFAFEFEQALADMTCDLYTVHEPAFPVRTADRRRTGNEELDRALSVLMSIRQEAAVHLGERQHRRGARSDWREEYFFALAVYGLHTAKFEDYEHRRFLTEFALVAAGVAAANLRSAKKAMLDLTEGQPSSHASSGSYPSYRVPVAIAHAFWRLGRQANGLRQAEVLLDAAADRYSHSVPLLQEYALLLAETGRHDEAMRLLKPLEDLCEAFTDYETLSRLGRLYKDMGDQILDNEREKIGPDDLTSSPAWSWYNAAFIRYRQAFAISNHYYPGANAATLALMLGNRETAEQLAEELVRICTRIDPAAFDSAEHAWLRATEGEIRLVLGKAREAVAYYREALGALDIGESGMAQSMYKQLCRLWWILGVTVAPVLEVFQRAPFALEPGPLGNCGNRIVSPDGGL